MQEDSVDMVSHSPVRQLGPVLLAAAALLLGGCAPVYSTTGTLLADYAEDNVVPHVQSTRDTDMATCGTGTGMNQFLASFGRVMHTPDYVMFYTDLLAGYCAAFRAADENLRYLRASNAGDVNEAADARIAEKRWHAIAAERRYSAFRHLTSAYGPLDGDCPDLDAEADQMTYLIGLVVGLQAMQSDARSGLQVGIPRDIAPRAADASRCLDNERWWGAPGAVRATVWTLVPGSRPDDRDIWATYRRSVRLADDAGMRLALALYVNGADNAGNTPELKNAVRHTARIGGDRAPERYVLVDRLATMEVRHFSDQLWTRESGKRTPVGALGRFPGETPAQPDTEGLL
ncbi:hypothetical protein H0Z60_02805 [Ectothiorhodospiraceae bacterium WFHF3C12]|nr:hypothetical protein [Ectothiorhodospiraceae bacterium WFHF3C12]